MFLRRPLIEANTQEFHIDGTWTDYKVTKVPHKAAVDALSAPTPTASAPGTPSSANWADARGITLNAQPPTLNTKVPQQAHQTLPAGDWTSGVESSTLNVGR